MPHEAMMDFPNWRFASGGKGRGRLSPQPRRPRAPGRAAPPARRRLWRRTAVRWRSRTRVAAMFARACCCCFAEERANGYQLMQAIERAQRRTAGARAPASVYPSLSQLGGRGVHPLDRARTAAQRRVREITDAGRAHLAERGERAGSWGARDDGDEHSARRLRPADSAPLACIAARNDAGRQPATSRKIAKAADLLHDSPAWPVPDLGRETRRD